MKEIKSAKLGDLYIVRYANPKCFDTVTFELALIDNKTHNRQLLTCSNDNLVNITDENGYDGMNLAAILRDGCKFYSQEEFEKINNIEVNSNILSKWIHVYKQPYYQDLLKKIYWFQNDDLSASKAIREQILIPLLIDYASLLAQKKEKKPQDGNGMGNQ